VSASKSLTVLECGPDPTTTGGMASVLSEYARFEYAGLRIRIASTWWPNSPFRTLGGFLKSAALVLLTPGIDVIHVHISEGGSFLREGSLLRLARMRGRPTIATLHGADFEKFARRHPRFVRTVLSQASVVVCLGIQTERQVSKLLPHARTEILLNPVEVHRRPTTGLSTRRVLFAGEVGERKGFDRLLRAWRLVHTAVPDAQLIVCGPLAAGWSPPIEQDGVQYLGDVSRDVVRQELSAARAACLPSRREVLPMFILEAVSSGVPVVATRTGEWESLAGCPAIRWVANDDRDALMIADELTLLLKSDDADVRVAGQDWVDAHCSPDVIAEKLFRISNSLVRGRTSV